VSEYAELLMQVPQLASLGAIFKSSQPIQLTEEETEYNVTAVKHVFDSHVVLQFNCTNTVKEQVLENVSVAVDLAEAEELVEELALPLAKMPYNETGQTYVVLGRPEGGIALGKCLCTLKFTVKEIDPSTGDVEEEGYPDEYQLEDLDISAADYVKAEPVHNFRAAWEELGEETEMADSYGLGPRESIQDAVEAVVAILGMQVCEGTDAVPPNARSHTSLLSGVFIGDVQALARLKFGMEAASREVAMNVVVRAGAPEVSEMVHQIIQDA
jgi:coatomer protein complex subunit gamma